MLEHSRNAHGRKCWEIIEMQWKCTHNVLILGTFPREAVLEHSRNAHKDSCAHPCRVPALCACIPTTFKHFSLCAFLLYSSTASRGKVPNVSTLCLHVYAYFYCITIVFCLPSSSVSIHFIQHFSICTFCFLLRISITFPFFACINIIPCFQLPS